MKEKIELLKSPEEININKLNEIKEELNKSNNSSEKQFKTNNNLSL